MGKKMDFWYKFGIGNPTIRLMPRTNEATDTDLKGIEELNRLGWKRGNTLLYQQELI